MSGRLRSRVTSYGRTSFTRCCPSAPVTASCTEEPRRAPRGRNDDEQPPDVGVIVDHHGGTLPAGHVRNPPSCHCYALATRWTETSPSASDIYQRALHTGYRATINFLPAAMRGPAQPPADRGRTVGNLPGDRRRSNASFAHDRRGPLGAGEVTPLLHPADDDVNRGAAGDVRRTRRRMLPATAGTRTKRGREQAPSHPEFLHVSLNCAACTYSPWSVHLKVSFSTTGSAQLLLPRVLRENTCH